MIDPGNRCGAAVVAMCFMLAWFGSTPADGSTPDEAAQIRATSINYFGPVPFGPPKGRLIDLAASPDGQLFVVLTATGKSSMFLPISTAGHLIDGTAVTAVVKNHAHGQLTAVAFTSDGRYLLTASSAGLQVSDARTFQTVTFDEKSRDVVAITQENGELLATTKGHKICHYTVPGLDKGDCTPWPPLRDLKPQSGLEARSGDNALRMSQQFSNLTPKDSNQLLSAFFAPDGRSVIALSARGGAGAPLSLELYDVDSGAWLRTLGELPAGGTTLHAFGDGRYFIYDAPNAPPMLSTYVGATPELLASLDADALPPTGERTRLGVGIEQAVQTSADPRAMAAGAKITQVQPDGAGARSGLQVGDVVSSVNGRAVLMMQDLPLLLAMTPLSRATNLQVEREGKTIRVPVIQAGEEAAMPRVAKAPTSAPAIPTPEPVVQAAPAPPAAAPISVESCQSEIASKGSLSEDCRTLFLANAVAECQREIASSGGVSDECREVFQAASTNVATTPATAANPPLAARSAVDDLPADVAATVRRGIDLQYGENDQAIDIEQARHWFTQAAEAGDVGAMVALTRLTFGDARKGWQNKAAEQGSFVAIQDLTVAAWRAGDYATAQRWIDRATALAPEFGAALAQQAAIERRLGQAVFGRDAHLLPIGPLAGSPRDPGRPTALRPQGSWLPAEPVSFGDAHVDEMQKRVRAYLVAPDLERESKLFEMIGNRVDRYWFWSQAVLLDLPFEAATARMYGPVAPTRVSCSYELEQEWAYESGGLCRDGKLFGMVRLRHRSAAGQTMLGTMIHGRVVEGGRQFEVDASGASRYYVGALLHGFPEGLGAKRHIGGTRQIGQWRGGKMEGWGGALVRSDFKKSAGSPAGPMRGASALGLKFLGHYADGVPNGLGVSIGDWIGTFLPENLRWVPSGLTYATDWKDGVAFGRGVRWFKKKSTEANYCTLQYGMLADGRLHGAKGHEEWFIDCLARIDKIMKRSQKKNYWGDITIVAFDHGQKTGMGNIISSYAATSTPGDDLVMRNKENRGRHDFTPKSGPSWLQRNAGKLVAIGAGAALAGASDLSGADKVEFLSAYTADVIGETGGTNMRGLGAQKQAEMGQSSGGGAAGGVKAPEEKRYQHSFDCPMGGSHSMEIVYYKSGCLEAAKRFAEVYGCNKIDEFASAGAQCSADSACGNAQCLESPPGAASSPSGEAFLDDILGGS